jgi:F-type H+-transporting ATPase subunit gamma
MRRAIDIQQEIDEISTVHNLTGVYESISSTQVAKIKDKVELSKVFFNLLWGRYTSIRLDPSSYITNREENGNGKNVFIIISAETGLSGDIDQRLIETMLQDYDAKTTDLIVLGSHGAGQLKARGTPFVRQFQVPPTDSYIDVNPVIEAILPYSKAVVYYEEYLSLGVQGIKKIDLNSRLQAMSEEADVDQDVISSADTIFEPSIEEIADQMEMTMMNLAFSEAILESTLAQDASRFNAMAVAKKRAVELLTAFHLEYHRSKRSDNDRRLREVMVSLKKKKRARERR